MSPFSNYLIPVALGILPSIIWLAFYLRKDCHPEPKYMLVKTFLMGIIVSPLAVALQLLFTRLVVLAPFALEPRGSAFFLWAALVEEVIKLYAVTIIVLRSPNFDEPGDPRIYLITRGLWFAAPA